MVVIPDTVSVEKTVERDVLDIVVNSVEAAKTTELTSTSDVLRVKVDVKVASGTVVIVSVPEMEVVAIVTKKVLVGVTPDMKHAQALLIREAGMVVSIVGIDMVVSRRTSCL